MMDTALEKVGLPVTCAFGDCGVKGFVRPQNHSGWYKSRCYRFNLKMRWYCPDHNSNGKAIDERFYQSSQTPQPEPEVTAETTEEELYALLD